MWKLEVKDGKRKKMMRGESGERWFFYFRSSELRKGGVWCPLFREHEGNDAPALNFKSALLAKVASIVQRAVAGW